MANRFLSNIRINDAYTFPASDGSADQVIATDGAGNLSFQTLADIAGTPEANFVYYNVKNSSGSTIAKGAAVMAVGTDGNSGHILIDEMVADGTVEPKYFIGVLETELTNGGIGRVIHFGELDQINTLAFQNGDVLWCDPSNPGGFTVTEPVAPNVKIAPAIVINSATNGKIKVRVQGNEGLHELHDVKIVSSADKDLLVWNNTGGYWENSKTIGNTIASGLTVNGNVSVTGTVADSDGDVGTAGQILSSTGTGTDWIDANTGGFSSILQDDFTGDGVTVAFTLANSVDNEVKTFVFLNGVYQFKDTYTVVGTTLTFDEAPGNGVAIEVMTMASLTSDLLRQDNFTANGVLTDFVLSTSVNNEVKTFVFLDGVYQFKDTYSVSGSTVSFSTAPSDGTEIEVISISSESSNSLGEISDVSLSAVADKDLLVWNNTSSMWENSKTVGNITTGDITTSGTVDGVDVSAFKASYDVHTHDDRYYTETEVDALLTNSTNWDTAYSWGDHAAAGYAEDYTVSYISTNTNAIAGNLYVFTATLTLTLPASPSAGDKIAVSNQSGTTTPIIARNGNNISGLAEDLTIDVDNLGFQLVYTGATKGWILI